MGTRAEDGEPDDEGGVENTEAIRRAFERSRRAVARRPAIGRGTAVTRVRVTSGLTCEIEDGPWKLIAERKERSGGVNPGPDPGVLGRAALGSCLAIGYVQWAAALGIPLTSLEVEVQADYDARGELGVADVSPAYSQVRYVVRVESDASEEEVLRALDEADARSPYLALFREPQDVRRQVVLAARR